LDGERMDFQKIKIKNPFDIEILFAPSNIHFNKTNIIEEICKKNCKKVIKVSPNWFSHCYYLGSIKD